MAQRKRRDGRRSRRIAPAVKARLHIDLIGARGDGVVIHDGGRIYVPYTAPGDVIDASITGERAAIEALVEESPHRVEAPCPHFGFCGGCALQHVSEEFYRGWKRRLVVDALAREGFEESIIAPLVVCAPDSRRRARFAVRKTAAGVIFGFNARSSDRIVDIEYCLVLDPALQKAMAGLRMLVAATPKRWRVFDMAVNLCDNGIDVSFVGGDTADDLSGPETMQLTEAAGAAGILRLSVDDAPLAVFQTPVTSFGGVQVAQPPGAFLQASREGETALVRIVTQAAGSAKRIADLFSGAGTFTLPLSQTAAMDAFDADAPAIAALDAAARKSTLSHPVTARVQNLFDRPLMTSELQSYDAVIFDPPRAGAKAQAAEIASSSVATVIGVSCNPASFARDAAILQAGGYALSQVTPVDQFVYAPHVELIGIFTKG